jgi:2-dehydro-3-deoxyphosphogluconate aldolase / (4S)-4-hydroxy-2-oxoglutarate aldolase
MAMNIGDVVAQSTVMPELLLSDAAHAVPAARALYAGGLKVIEISVRGAGGAVCIEAVRKGVPEALAGAGSLTRAVDFAAADRAGAQFGATPGLTQDLAAASRGARFPLLPGVMTPTEVMTARNAGFMVQKFYSSTPAGGVTLLKLLHDVFPDVNFVPSGALTSDLAAEYLRLPNVAAVAGSWPELQALFVQGDWPRVETWARAVAQLKRT